MDELKTCPFCGRQATRIPFIDDEYKQIRYIGCEKCCVVSFIGVSNDEVIKAWNTRAERTCTVIEENMQGLNMIVESCGNCGNYMPRHAWTGKLLPYCPHCGARVIGGEE